MITTKSRSGMPTKSRTAVHGSTVGRVAPALRDVRAAGAGGSRRRGRARRARTTEVRRARWRGAAWSRGGYRLRRSVTPARSATADDWNPGAVDMGPMFGFDDATCDRAGHRHLRAGLRGGPRTSSLAQRLRRPDRRPLIGKPLAIADRAGPRLRDRAGSCTGWSTGWCASAEDGVLPRPARPRVAGPRQGRRTRPPPRPGHRHPPGPARQDHGRPAQEHHHRRPGSRSSAR